MNKYQEALNKIKEDYEETHCQGMGTCYDFEDIKLFQKLVDKATPMKPVKLIKSYWHLYTFYENVETDCCPICEERLIAGKCCSNNGCRQAIDWSKDE